MMLITWYYHDILMILILIQWLWQSKQQEITKSIFFFIGPTRGLIELLFFLLFTFSLSIGRWWMRATGAAKANRGNHIGYGHFETATELWPHPGHVASQLIECTVTNVLHCSGIDRYYCGFFYDCLNFF